MNSSSRWTRLIAAVELVLILPAGLFMTALVVRELPAGNLGFDTAAQTIVTWYASRVWTRWLLLLGMPLLVLALGVTSVGIALAKRPTPDRPRLISLEWAAAEKPTAITALTSLASGLILLVVVLHMLAN